MIYSSLAVLALSASAMVNPLTNLVHLHPWHAQPVIQPDTRISLKVYNRGTDLREVTIGGQLYAVRPHKTLSIKTQEGTLAYADSRRAGDSLILEVTPNLNHDKISIN